MARPVHRSALRSAILVGTMIGLSAGFATRRAAAEPPSADSEASGSEPSPSRDQYPPPSARVNTVIGGVATTAVWYGLALGSSYIWPDTVGANDLRIPVAGPWLALSHSGCGNVSDCSNWIVALRAIATALDAVGQTGGLAIAGEGLFMPTREPARTAPARSSSWEVHPMLDAGKNTVSFGVLGVF